LAFHSYWGGLYILALGFGILAMGDPFPRAWVVHGVEVIPDERTALARLSADDFDLRRTAVVAEPPSLPLSDPAGAGSTARVTAFAPNDMTVEVSAAADGLLVLSEVYYPGWQASVDGAPAALVRADGLLRGVPVPQGQSTPCTCGTRRAAFGWGWLFRDWRWSSAWGGLWWAFGGREDELGLKDDEREMSGRSGRASSRGTDADWGTKQWEQG
jgi:hypothetical protein